MPRGTELIIFVQIAIVVFVIWLVARLVRGPRLGGRQDQNAGDQTALAVAAKMTMEAAKPDILAEAERTGRAWLPRIDPGFVTMIRQCYQTSGATTAAVDAVLAEVFAEGRRTGASPEMSWITGFQAVCALELIAQREGAIREGDHPLLSYFNRRRAEFLARE